MRMKVPVNTGLVPHPHPSASRRNKVEETKSAPKSKKSAADKKIPYRYIQKVAVSLNLPGNLKREDLELLIERQKDGDEEFVREFKRRLYEEKSVKRAQRKVEQEDKSGAPLNLTKTQVQKPPESRPPCSPTPAPDSATPAPSHTQRSSERDEELHMNNRAYGLEIPSEYYQDRSTSSRNSSTPFPPCPHGNFRNYDLSFYQSEFYPNPREWQYQMPPHCPNLSSNEASTSSGQQSYTPSNLTQSSSYCSVSAYQGYYPYSMWHYPPLFDPYSSAFSDYHSTTNTLNYGSVRTSPVDRLPSFHELKYMSKPPSPFNDPSQNLTHWDANVPSDIASQTTSCGSGRSISSSMENNFSWSTINQDVLNYLSQEASFKSASSQRTNSYLGSEGGNLFDQSLEFQSSNDTANLRRLDLFPSYRQTSTPQTNGSPVCNPSLQSHFMTASSHLYDTNFSSYSANTTATTINTNPYSHTEPNSGQFCYGSCFPGYPCYRAPNPPSTFSSLTENHRTHLENGGRQDAENNSEDDLFLDESSGDITLRLSPSDSVETSEFDSDGTLIINEDTLIEDSNETQPDSFNHVANNQNDGTYHALESTVLTQEMPHLDSQIVESIFNETIADGKISEAYENLTAAEIDEVCRQSYSAIDSFTQASVVENGRLHEAKQNENTPSTEESSSSSFISVGHAENPPPYACPVSGCHTAWDSVLPIEDHIRKYHEKDIIDVSQFKVRPYELTLSSVLQEGSKNLIIEAGQKLFIVRVIKQEARIMALLQHIPKPSDSNPNSPSLEGHIKVMKSNEAPQSWIGKVMPYSSPVDHLLASNQCLAVNVADLDSVIAVFADVLPPLESNSRSSTLEEGRYLRSNLSQLFFETSLQATKCR
ncbi:unnamed protein product [Bemisia tabaci]|uniref:Uncharacterized protein n=1 Tax=Bemisia tabaci TaxID=7038 RepID=A0A9P0A1N9_BEMTA|nr:unnamed protein product [Bemisia tabaci]